MLRKILLTAATKSEIAPVKRYLLKSERFLNCKLEFLVTGIGKERSYQIIKNNLSNHEFLLIINFGSAGAINPHLKVLDLFFPTKLTTEDFPEKSVPIVDDLFYFIQSKGWKLGTLFTSSTPVCSKTWKNHLYNLSYDAVDMEAYAIYDVAQQFSIPFYSLKIITDLADENTYRTFSANLELAIPKLTKALEDLITYLAQHK